MRDTTFESRNPATGEVFATHQQLTDSEMRARIDACHEAFLDWSRQPVEARAAALEAVAGGLRAHKDALADLMTKEMGKLRKQSLQEIELCAQICLYTAAKGPELLQDEDRKLPDGKRGLVCYRPIGLVYGIQPWNFPLYQAIRFAVASLMAGNGVLLKHASNVLGCGKQLEKIFAEALPAHLFTLLIIDHEQSDAVIANPKVRGVTFTGSPDAGRKVAVAAAEHLKKTVLELGSNDAYVVLSDADVDLAVKVCVQGRTYNNGETCVAAKRFVVVDGVYEAFQTAFVDRMSALRQGDPMDENSQIGPMAREDLRDQLNEQVQQSVEAGARVLCGGKIPDGEGFYYPPTVLADVKPGQPAYDDELFGPVASLIRALDDTDAMRIANDSRFGLGGGIFSKDTSRAVKLAKEEFDTGMVFVNGFGLATPDMPFGGVKDSGYGREHGGFGIREFVNIKAVAVKA